MARLEREAQTLKRVGEDIFRVQEKIDSERLTRETAITHIQVRPATFQRPAPPLIPRSAAAVRDPGDARRQAGSGSRLQV